MSAGPSAELESSSLHIDRVIDGAPRDVWRYLADSSLLSTWIEGGSIEPRAGGAITLLLPRTSAPHERVLVTGRVTRFDPPHLLEFTWDDPRVPSATVRIALEGHRGQTRMSIVQRRKDESAGALLLPVFSGAVGLLATGILASHGSASGATGPMSNMAEVSGGASPPSSSTLRGPSWRRTPVLIGLVGVLILAGIGAAFVVPKLIAHPSAACSVGDPGPVVGNWTVAGNETCGPWTEDGKPVVLVVGSIACPYCGASSWPLAFALSAFGVPVNLTAFATTNPNDVYPNTPEITLAGNSSESAYLSWDPQVGTNDRSITLPALSAPASTYFSAFDPEGAVPFIAVAGVYFSMSTLLDPIVFENATGVPLSPTQVQQNITSGHGSFLPELNASIDWVEAVFWAGDTLVGISPPTAVAHNPSVDNDYDDLQRAGEPPESGPSGAHLVGSTLTQVRSVD